MKCNLLTLIMVVLILSTSSNGFARDQIRIVGSSTVYPFAASVAEHFGKVGDFRTPVVESTGTGAGFKLFCTGSDESTPDISNASRPLLDSERAICNKQGIHNIVEVKIGYDGIVLANAMQGPSFSLTKKQLFLSLARDVAMQGKLVTNPYRRWKQIDASLPDLPIKVYGTPPVSGTRDTFVELVMQKGCLQVPEFMAVVANETDRKRQCQLIREDGVFIEAGENGNLITQKLLGDPDALGILGFSFVDQNMGKIRANVIDGIAPSFETIQNSSYGISRPLYFYVKGEHLSLVQGIREYVQEFTSEAAIGDEGYLVNEGLVPLPEAERNKLRHDAKAALSSQ
jgi:phosphate transport system substrate-binding protein